MKPMEFTLKIKLNYTYSIDFKNNIITVSVEEYTLPNFYEEDINTILDIIDDICDNTRLFTPNAIIVDSLGLHGDILSELNFKKYNKVYVKIINSVENVCYNCDKLTTLVPIEYGFSEVRYYCPKCLTMFNQILTK